MGGAGDVSSVVNPRQEIYQQRMQSTHTGFGFNGPENVSRRILGFVRFELIQHNARVLLMNREE